MKLDSRCFCYITPLLQFTGQVSQSKRNNGKLEMAMSDKKFFTAYVITVGSHTGNPLHHRDSKIEGYQ